MYTLYLKEHNVTGLKYLGYTERNPHKYGGSGVYWRKHIKKHGNDVTTTVLFESEDLVAAKLRAKELSNEWDIVNNPFFANLKTEDVDGGIPGVETRTKIGAKSKGRVFSDESKRKMSVSRKKHIMTPEHKANIGKAAKGRVLSEESRRKISEAMKGRTQTEEHRRKNSEAAKRRYANVHSATD
jgi:hypothetical protein